MPIPPTAAPSGLNIRPLTGGRWEAVCGRCLSTSTPTPSVDASQAWAVLQRDGWQHFVSEYRGSGYAICPPCAHAGPPGMPKRGARKRR